jgi:hypothetical protein
MTRYLALLLPVVACLAGCGQPAARQPSGQEEKAVKAIEALGGKVTRDEKLPGRPVVEVDLGKTEVTDAGLKDLKELKGLRKLYLSGTKITDAGLKDLKELKGLEMLDLTRTKITDAGLKDLKELKDLKTLYLYGNQITDAGLKDLKELKGLQMLCLAGTKISSAGLKDLKQALPKTFIYPP